MRLFHILTLFTLLALLASCTDIPSPALRLGTNIWPGYEPLYLARHKNYLDEKKVRLVEYSSASQVIQAYRNELIDAAALTLDEVLLLLEGGEDLKLILVMDISNGGDVIVGQSELATIQDIRGKKVGVENNALGAYVITRAMEMANIDMQSIKIVQLDISEQEKAFKAHKVDAVVTFDPVKSNLLKFGGSLLFDSRQIPGEIVDVLVVRKTYIKQHPEIEQYVLDAWYQSLAYINQQPREAAKILGARMQQDIDATLAAYQGFKLPDKIENRQLIQAPDFKLKKSAEKLQQLMLNNGLLKKQVNLDSLFSNAAIQHRKK